MGMNTPDMDRLAIEADGWRRAGDLARACPAFERILGENSKHALALRGRARIALAQGEPDAIEWFDRALKIDPGNADLWLGKAQALDVAGDANGAMTIARQLVEQAPNWLEGLRFLAQLRLGAGETDFAGHYAAAVGKAPQDPNIRFDWANQLAATDRLSDAADIAAKARLAFPNEPAFALQEATHASADGELERAESIFAGLHLNSPERLRSEARHRIRQRQFDHAEELLDKALQTDPDDISVWALISLVWRATDNSKAAWLHSQEGLYGRFQLMDDARVLSEAVPALRKLHENSALPIGQSLRGGTQTRGNLFDRLEPEFASLKAAILATLEDYRAGLPEQDDKHPLLKHRGSTWRMAGSWSVRLSGSGDHHKSHIHPAGFVSSALYCEVPRESGVSEANSGWLEIGRPPADLMMDLEPLAVIEPKPGYLALFPSTLYHGTRPFAEGTRMSVAFDVVSAG